MVIRYMRFFSDHDTKTKIIGMILIAILTVSLIGCGLGKPNRESEVQIPEDAFEYNGVIVSVKDKNMDNVFAAFGEPEKKKLNPIMARMF